MTRDGFTLAEVLVAMTIATTLALAVAESLHGALTLRTANARTRSLENWHQVIAPHGIRLVAGSQTVAIPGLGDARHVVSHAPHGTRTCVRSELQLLGPLPGRSVIHRLDPYSPPP